VARVKISVIVPSFNQGRFLEETIRSIVTQAGISRQSAVGSRQENAQSGGGPLPTADRRPPTDSPIDLELILIDGGSTDETLDVISKHESDIAFWISEPDRGQADAINKGLRRATGDIVTWFGADDLYAAGIFAALEPAWRANPHAIYAGPVANFYSRGRQTLLRPHGLTLANVIQYWQRRSLWHDPGLFWSRAVIDAAGEIDTTLHYSFDYDYLIRALQNSSVEYLDTVAAGFRLHRHSKSISQTEQMMAETVLVSQRYWGLLDDVDREGFERSEHAARVRRGASQLIRGKREGLTLLGRALRERPFASIAQLALLAPTVLMERFRRSLPTRYF
jgi:glycosyltransferase involved in cell wall biosynthesis